MHSLGISPERKWQKKSIFGKAPEGGNFKVTDRLYWLIGLFIIEDFD